jgi:hypothetical protein
MQMKDTLNSLSKQQINGYTEAAAHYKALYHKIGKQQLKKLAIALDLQSGTYDIRSNKGGIAVCGEITLHTDTLYCQLSQSCLGTGHEILFRSCKGRKDYTGGSNNFASAKCLDNPENFALQLKH